MSTPLIQRRSVALPGTRIDQIGIIARIPVRNAVEVTIAAALMLTTGAAWTQNLNVRKVIGGGGNGDLFQALTSAAPTAYLLEADLGGVTEIIIEVATANAAGSHANIDVSIGEKASG